MTRPLYALGVDRAMTPDEARLVLNGLGWPDFMIDIGIRAKFCCEYCGKELLSSVDAYDSWQKDHIVPNGSDNISNLAVACKTCNFIKRRTDPSMGLAETDRESLIKVAKAVIDERRRGKRLVLRQTLEAANVLMRKSGAASGI